MLSIPEIMVKDISPFYIPLKELSPYVKKIYEYSLKINYKILFYEIPYCIFGRIDNSIVNKLKLSNLPPYRIKKQTEMCNECRCSNFCDGFFVEDIKRFGTRNLKPIC